MTHTHTASRESGPYPYIAPVAGRYGTENRAAHGNVVFLETCECGAERSAARNQRHEELGPWGEGRAQRAAREERAESARRAGLRAAAAARLAPRVRVVECDGHGMLVEIAGEGRWHDTSSIQASLGGMSAEQRAVWADVLVAGGVSP